MTAATRRPTGRRHLVAAAVSAFLALGACRGGGGSDGSDVVAGAPAPSTSGTSTASEGSPSTAAVSAPGTQDDLPTTKSAPAGATTTDTAASGDGGALGGDTGDSPLRRRDVPPEGVAAQLGPPLAATDGCGSDASAPLAVAPNSSTIAVGDSTLVCVDGSAQRPVAVQARLPDGRVRELAQPDDDGATRLVVAVLDPVGAYAITVTQGEETAATSVNVTLPSQPVVEALDPSDAPAGTTFRFAVASPASGQTVELDLYRGVDYATTLPPARTDSSGRVEFELPTLGDDPPGSYCIRTRPPGRCASFTLT